MTVILVQIMLRSQVPPHSVHLLDLRQSGGAGGDALGVAKADLLRQSGPTAH